MKRFIMISAVLLMVVSAFAAVATEASTPQEEPVPEVLSALTPDKAPETEGPKAPDETRGPGSRGQYFPEDYGPRFTYWLVNENISVEQRKLSEISRESDQYYPGKNKADVNLTRSQTSKMVFSYPNRHDFFKTKLNPSPQYDPPVINFTINTLGGRDPDTGDPLGGAGKTLNFEIIIDTNGDYDPYNPSDTAVEGKITFPSYTTLGEVHTDSNGQRQAEELVELAGSWATDIPQQITNGRIHLQIWRTDNIADDNSPLTPDLLIYCGFSGKTSWLALPFPHPLTYPSADAGPDQGNMSMGHNKIMEYENVYFDGTGSYDPQDDLGVDGQADTEDVGENNHNIDDGIPEGETDLGEIDHLEYRWDYGVGAQSSGWQASPFAQYKYHLPSDWKSTHPGEPYIFTVTLTVRDIEGLTDSDIVNITIHPYDEAPAIKVMEIRPDFLDGEKNVGLPGDGEGDDGSTVMLGTRVTFFAEATHNDPNEATMYFWDLDNTGTFSTAGGEGVSSTVHKSYAEEDKHLGEFQIGLRVYDAEPGTSAATYSEEWLTLNVLPPSSNQAPVAFLEARVPGGDWENGSMIAPLHTTITLNAAKSRDRDNLAGFDIDGDGEPDQPLMYRFDLGDERTSEGDPMTSWGVKGFIASPEYSFNYSAAGNEMQYLVTLTVDDGIDTDTHELAIKINLPPNADAGRDIGVGGERVEVGQDVFMDATGTYDPNDDINGDKEISSGEADNLEYTWNMGDGTTYTESHAMGYDGIDNDNDGMVDETGEAPDGSFDRTYTHVYSKEGIYNVRLTTVDPHGLKDTDTAKVVVQARNKAPRAIVTADRQEIWTGETIEFSAEDSFDPDGEAFTDNNDKTRPARDLYWNKNRESVYWDFGDGNSSDNTKNYDLVQLKKYTRKGVFNVTVTVADIHGLAVESERLMVTVKNRPPVADAGSNLTYPSDPSHPEARLVFLQGGNSRDPDGRVMAWKWSYGDGTNSEWMNRSDIQHTYESYGDYYVTLYVKDDNGDVSQGHTITVRVIKDEKDEGRDNTEINNIITGLTYGAVGAAVAVAVVAGIAFYLRKKNEDVI